MVGEARRETRGHRSDDLLGAGIDWTTVRRDDPLGRGFEYVPTTEGLQFAPIDELWA